MPQPFMIALGIALVAGIGAVIGLGILSLTIGGVDFLFGRPRINFLKTKNGFNGFAFSFHWNAAKEPARMDVVKVRLYNPFGNPTMLEVLEQFDPQDKPFGQDIDLGSTFSQLRSAIGNDGCTVEVEVSSSKDGYAYSFQMKGDKFLAKLDEATESLEQYAERTREKAPRKTVKYGVIHRDTIADTVPGKGPTLKIAANPAFAGEFAAGAAAGAAGGAAAEAVPNFAMAKVWIEPGCIVCNACEDISPKVFEVLADTCIVREGAPLDDGLNIEEAADACPVEVIKFEKA